MTDFSWTPKSLQMVTAVTKLKDTWPLEENLWQAETSLWQQRLLYSYIVKAMVFPIVMYGCESWTIKMAEHQRTDALKLWCYRRLLRVPWTTSSNHSILKEINPEYSLERLMLKLKRQFFGHLMQRANSLGKTEGRRRRRWQKMR